MITDNILNILQNIAEFIINLIPSFNINVDLQEFFNGLALAGNLFDLVSLFYVFGVVITSETVIFSYKSIVFLYRLIRG